MKAEILYRPCVPLTYIQLTLDQAAERGIPAEQVLRGLGIAPALLEKPDTRFSLLHYTQIIYRAMQLSGDYGLGYDFGLRARLTAHGMVGFGLMSLPTLRAAVEFGIKNIQLLTPCYSLRLQIENDIAVIEMREAIPFGPLRRYGFDMLLVGFALAGQQLVTSLKPDLELWFDYPEPDYYARYRERLPPMRFAMGSNQLRFPAVYLDSRLSTANPVTAKLMAEQCARELSVVGPMEDFLARVRALLVSGRKAYPGLETVSGRLNISARTLKRRLQEHGVSFQQLLDEIRQRDSLRMIEDPTLRIADIAQRLGFADPANFTRAFRKWTGETPSNFRARTSSPVSSSQKI
jgi:AraC-like DNA-binding protein